MKSDSYLVVDENALPEVYQKVVKANALLESGEASTTSEAVRMGGNFPGVCIINTGTLCSLTRRRPPPAY